MSLSSFEQKALALLTAIEQNTRRNTPSKRDKPSDAYSDDFLTFWAAYPRKIGKGAAWKSWQKMAAPRDSFMRAVVAFAKSCADKEPRFIPHPATWLNQRRWEDEPDAKIVKVTAKCQFCGEPATITVNGVGSRCSKDECSRKFYNK